MEEGDSEITDMITFVAEDEEFEIEKPIIMIHSLYVSDILDQIDSKSQPIRVLLPKWAKASTFSLLMKLLQGNTLAELTINNARDLLSLSDFLKIKMVVDKCIKDIITPNLKRTNVYLFMELAYNKCNEESSGNTQENDSWVYFLDKCMEVAAKNSHFIFTMAPQILDKMPGGLIESLCERALRLFAFSFQDNAAVVEALQKCRKCDSLYELLRTEEEKVSQIIIPEMVATVSDPPSPQLSWALYDIKGSFYRDSPGFLAYNNYWTVSAWNLQKEKDVILISLKQNVNKMQAGNKEEKEKGEESDEIEIPTGSILVISAITVIRELEDLPTGVCGIYYLLSGSKSTNIIREMSTEAIWKVREKMTIDIYFRIQHVYSGIVSFISCNFNWLFKSVQIKHLAKQEFLILLRHKNVNIKHEDHVIYAFRNWYVEEHLLENIDEILECIYWSHVSLRTLLDLVNSIPEIRTHHRFKDIFTEEILRRYEKRPLTTQPRSKYIKKSGPIHSPRPDDDFAAEFINCMLDPDKEVKIPFMTP